MRVLGRGGWLAILCGVVILAVLGSGMFVAFNRGMLKGSVIGSQAITPTPPVPGGVYREAVVGTPTTLNPLLASTRVDRDLSALIFSGLTKTDAQGTVVPDLASRWKVEDDGKKYTFTLRDDVTWHDGQHFTAKDVLFTIRQIQDAGFTGDRALADFWRTVNVETPDDRTVVCTLPNPSPPSSPTPASASCRSTPWRR